MHPPIFVTINGVMFNAVEIQFARPVETTGDKSAGVKVYFIHGGHSIIRDITVEQLEAVLASAVREAAPF